MAIYDFNTEKQEYTQAFYELMLSVLSSGGGNFDISAPRLTLISRVKLKIDELQAQEEGVQFIETSSDDISNVLDQYINGLLDECAKHIHQTAPLHVIIPSDGSDATLGSSGTIGHVILPSDYLRFVSFKMDTWLQEVAYPILITGKKYKKQKYSATRGGIAKPIVALNSIKVTSTPVAQVDTVTLFGTSGNATYTCNGLSTPLTFNSSLEQTALDFIALYASEYLDLGIILTAVGHTIVATASEPGIAFTSPWVTNVSDDLTGSTEHTTPNVPAIEGKRTLEYYSVPSGTHNIAKFLYIAEVGAEYIQDNLIDALTWLCASKVLQIMGDIANQGGYAEKALEQVELSYKNLM